MSVQLYDWCVDALLAGRRALVTGAAGGIGKAVAARFAEAGAQAIGREVIVDGIRVNAVCPGGVRTPMSDATIEFEAARDGVSVSEKRAEHNSRVPRGRLAEPDEIADVCVFLASELAAHVACAS